MKRAVLLLGLALGLVSVGCGDDAPTSGSGAPASSGAAVALADSDLPVAADFEEAAEKDISQTNYKSELDALEKEIAAP